MPDQQLTPAARAVPLSTQIADQLRHRIESGEWPVGRRIPGEHELVAQLRVSRNTVREAVRGLVHAGLLEARPGDGTYVVATSALEVALARRATAEDALEVFEAREALELYAARSAAEHAPPGVVDRMARALDRRDAAGSLADAIAADREFHLEMFAASGNRLIADMYRSLERSDTLAVPAGVPEDEALRLFREPWQRDDSHRLLLAAVRDGDPDAAQAAVIRLIRFGRELFLRNDDANGSAHL
ncbi:FadR/GntR family transcriptional regulator [Tsukamurella soli]|uniref:FadR/GntR family transcriptional regulator n=1 Tax=Tsukamurella soli TaxID=644556 RepID=A0ABP8J342_9ACTN